MERGARVLGGLDATRTWSPLRATLRLTAPSRGILVEEIGIDYDEPPDDPAHRSSGAHPLPEVGPAGLQAVGDQGSRTGGAQRVRRR